MITRPASVNIPPTADPGVAFTAGAVYGAAVQKYRSGGDKQSCAALADAMRAIATGDTFEDVARAAYDTWGDEMTKENETNGA